MRVLATYGNQIFTYDNSDDVFFIVSDLNAFNDAYGPGYQALSLFLEQY